MGKLSEALLICLASILAVAAIHYGHRVLISDSFVVKGESMEPEFHTGERVRVNKLKMGARIYTDYDFSKPSLSSFRLPGFSKLKAGDIVIVNYPYARSEDTITFRINYVYMKRCYGAPGDTVRIVNGWYVNPSDGGLIGNPAYQQVLSETPDSVLAADGVALKSLKVNDRLRWTIRDFGPMYVPGKGDTIRIDCDNYRLWRRLILFETGVSPTECGGQVFFSGEPMETYTFRSDWYFLGGDNVLNSEDSRYIGLFPESYVIGIVRRRR